MLLTDRKAGLIMAGGIDCSRTWNIVRVFFGAKYKRTLVSWTTVSWKDKCIGRYCIMFQIDPIDVHHWTIVSFEIFTSVLFIFSLLNRSMSCNEYNIYNRVLEKTIYSCDARVHLEDPRLVFTAVKSNFRVAAKNRYRCIPR